MSTAGRAGSRQIRETRITENGVQEAVQVDIDEVPLQCARLSTPGKNVVKDANLKSGRIATGHTGMAD
ncbi:hypothetical protein PC129_g15303 [Phytophthora cactorum]|uniref:Uncharacterized protein n=1 Tax=Phytophthora cactorum TaxID=29920 RepID=A0A8T1DMI3_9STRA|nr:hypothetical protein Pcac1_g19826 [Phytophthora cactorum]KAG2806326.1 hypothetical protein PC111_g17420 [Phytophthora cactorum]KAG2827546.1 hypothetical protein PC112_g8812 [Phytophthora cactorum]KAG2844185.1 hypothetical protein PC113_g18444 [Phytophthora cactorum]KAG2895204.1 hypothetical protein PC115_g17915 [Phytophthora cactorum]